MPQQSSMCIKLHVLDVKLRGFATGFPGTVV